LSDLGFGHFDDLPNFALLQPPYIGFLLKDDVVDEDDADLDYVLPGADFITLKFYG
jgi:hypothetical protein